ncbi:VWA domain-containing protein [Cellulophaga sp. L1A9]|uniref:vWA domain-containing protein n=1 Tax=Cellulophaga sp. L1A9 TaxID=2686362 RepID=UPI00131D20B4|nr:VWA domain-containing protein [Cellulophaga sp. L1A9]
MKKTLLLFFIAILSNTINAQVKTIHGTVTDNTGPLPGVNVSIKNASTGTQTDFDGKYTISASEGDTLVFTYIGYETKEFTVADSLLINMTLEVASNQLEEVVIVGYGTQKKRRVTSAATRVSSQSIQRGRKPKSYKNNSAQPVYDHVAELQMSSISYSPIAIHSQGNSTVSENNQPLYVVDGVLIQAKNNNIVANLDPNSIDEINVYKGEKASALYGASAKNGCIVITTKSGNYRITEDEKYAQITENPFKRLTLNPLSTFSIDVDKAGYSNIRRLINAGSQIPVDAVKIEEMINYFNYEYPQPVGEHPFSINLEAAKTPWNDATKLVRIGIQGKKYLNENLPASNLTFLIDVSGSMSNQNKLPLLKSAFKLLVNQLREKDSVSIVVYAGAAGVVLEPTRGDEKVKIIEALDNLSAGGSTAGGQGIELAYALAEKNFKPNKNNRVIMATDGDFNVGASSDKDMETLIEEKRKSGIFLSVLGFGMGNYKDSKLEKLADKGNGNHAYIDTMQEAQKVFGEEFGGTLYTIAKDVKIQVEFNPAKVQAYRLIGYENRLLADEDFIDDKKDAGELGSGHAVTALYEIIPIGVQSDFIKEIPDLKYTQAHLINEDSDDLFTVKFRYKKPNEDKSIEMVEVYKNQFTEMSADFKFSAAVALFGMHLRNSPYLNDSKMKDVLGLATSGKGIDKKGYRSEFIRLVKTVDSSL